MFPEAPYALAKMINLTHTPPAGEATEDDVTPVPQLFFFAVSERWRCVWEVCTNTVRSAPSMVKFNPWLLFERFWKHCCNTGENPRCEPRRSVTAESRCH